MTTFNKDLAIHMFDANVRFSKFIHLPTLDVSQPIDAFDEFIEEYADQYFETLAETWPNLTKHIDRDSFPTEAWELAEVLSDFCNKEFLICAEVAIPKDFKFTADGEVQSYRSGFGNYYQIWFFADTTTEAAKYAINWAEKLFDRRMKAAQEYAQEKNND